MYGDKNDGESSGGSTQDLSKLAKDTVSNPPPEVMQETATPSDRFESMENQIKKAN